MSAQVEELIAGADSLNELAQEMRDSIEEFTTLNSGDQAQAAA